MDLNNIGFIRILLLGRSLPAEGEWIEIANKKLPAARTVSLSLQRESGLKSSSSDKKVCWSRSLPAEGEWIEMTEHVWNDYMTRQSLPAEGERIEISCPSPP